MYAPHELQHATQSQITAFEKQEILRPPYISLSKETTNWLNNSDG